MLGHEINFLRGDEIRGKYKVALVFAIFLVHQNHHVAGFDLGNDFLGAADADVRLLFEQAMNRIHLRGLHG